VAAAAGDEGAACKVVRRLRGLLRGRRLAPAAAAGGGRAALLLLIHRCIPVGAAKEHGRRACLGRSIDLKSLPATPAPARDSRGHPCIRLGRATAAFRLLGWGSCWLLCCLLLLLLLLLLVPLPLLLLRITSQLVGAWP
jgi:hypothetical protein